jgi:thioredoxin-like negative regulator of GroEL
LDKALRRDTPPVAVLLERARLARELEDFVEAEKRYRQALEREPFDDDACYGLAQCLRALKRPEEAQVYEERRAQIDRDVKRLHQLHELMAKQPNDLELPYEAGVICLRNLQKGEAQRWFRSVLQRNPHHAGAQEGLKKVLGR